MIGQRLIFLKLFIILTVPEVASTAVFQDFGVKKYSLCS